MGSGCPWKESASLVKITARLPMGATTVSHRAMSVLQNRDPRRTPGAALSFQVEQEVHATAPVPMAGMHREIGMDVQEPAGDRLVQAPSLEGLVDQQVLDPRQPRTGT